MFFNHVYCYTIIIIIIIVIIVLITIYVYNVFVYMYIYIYIYTHYINNIQGISLCHQNSSARSSISWTRNTAVTALPRFGGILTVEVQRRIAGAFTRKKW